MYKELGNKLNLPEIEKDVLQFWEKQQIFKKSIELRDHGKPFIFYEGPPTANGRPGIHHVLARTVKDIVCRLKTMQGYRVERKAGWDTHGLPVEIEVEKSLGIETKDGIIAYGVDKFNEKCRDSVWTYKTEWDELTRRIAYWIDLDDPYITYDNRYIESVWWILSELWKKNLIYQGYKILPYCPRCETPLSSHEVAQGYRDVDDPSIYVKMPLLNDASTSFLVWTTTPWTLISNVALALNPDLEYVLVEHNGEKLILAKERLQVLEGEYKIRQTYRGSELSRQHYKRLFSYIPVDKNAFYTVTADFVSAEDGTGIVHIAPAFGEDDYNVGKRYDLPFINPIDKSGAFDERITDYAGQFFKQADKAIVKALKQEQRLYKQELHRHSYPHCWRCDTPLIYYAYESWYIKTTEFKERMLKHNEGIHWYPKEVGKGRFGEWLKNNVDWSLSRDRFWGTPLPIWSCEACYHHDCIGSIAELKKRAGVESIPDLHKPYVDELTIKCAKCGEPMRRTPEVIDVWFDSGAMPVAQWHYPFENKEIFDRNFPADFISEGVDQTRGWFYSLLAISVLLFDRPCYKSCISLEMVLDKDGQKMSKSRGNSVNPFEIIEQHGADPLRWYLMAVSPPWQPTRFDEEGVAETVRKFFGTLLNTYNFFAVYANIDKFVYDRNKVIGVEKRPEIDRWISSLQNKLVAEVAELWKRYELTKIVRAIASFVLDDLSNWYVRRNRRRFWKSEINDDKLAAYQTLYEVLHAVARLMAPIAPYTSEELFRNLASANAKNDSSVHLASYPQPEEAAFVYRDTELEARMELIRSIIFTGRSLRNEAGIKVRQPLSRIILVPRNDEQVRQIKEMAALIHDELNIKEIDFIESVDLLLRKRAEPDFKKLGPRFGKDVNRVATMIRNLDSHQISELEKTGRLELRQNDFSGTIERDDVRISAEGIGEMVASLEGTIPVGLDKRLDDKLIAEGVAREIVNRIQNMRKEAGYDIIDRIEVSIRGSAQIVETVRALQDYIKNETLAEQIFFDKNGLEFAMEWDIDGEAVTIAIQRHPNKE